MYSSNSILLKCLTFRNLSEMTIFVDYVNGGELFTHLYQHEHFSEDETRVYVAEIVLALETLHRVTLTDIVFQDNEKVLLTTM